MPGAFKRRSARGGSGAGHRRRLLGLAAATVGAEAALMRLRGHSVGRNTIVRCRQGHLFTTMWIPGASLKAIRLGWMRFQRCPVGHHWSLVTPVKDSELTDEERRIAGEHRDLRVP